MRKLLTALMVGGALVTASNIAAAQNRVGFSITVANPVYVVSVNQPAFVALPTYGVVAPQPYEYRAAEYFRPVPPPMPERRAVYIEHRHHEERERHQW